MEPLRTLKAFIARLAGAPLATPPIEPDGLAGSRRASRHTSGLYADVPAASNPNRTARQRDGDEGEVFARRYLERAGLVFVAANVRYRDGELDLVLRDEGRGSSGGPTLVFVEVRRRARGTHGGAAASITGEKRRRLVAAAAHYLVGLGVRTLPACRFDVVTLEGDRRQGFRIAWIRDAFREEG